MTVEQIKTILKRELIERMELVMEEDELKDDTLLFGYDENGEGLGLDSIDVLELIVILKKNFHIEVEAEENREIFENINTLTDFVMNHMEN